MALPAGRYVVGEGGEKRTVALCGVAFGRFPVVNAQLREWVADTGRRISAARAAKDSGRPSARYALASTVHSKTDPGFRGTGVARSNVTELVELCSLR